MCFLASESLSPQFSTILLEEKGGQLLECLHDNFRLKHSGSWSATNAKIRVVLRVSPALLVSALSNQMLQDYLPLRLLFKPVMASIDTRIASERHQYAGSILKFSPQGNWMSQRIHHAD